MAEIVYSNPSKQSPCKECKDRYMGCHSVCGKYAAYRAALEEEKEFDKFDKDCEAYIRAKNKKMQKIARRIRR